MSEFDDDHLSANSNSWKAPNSRPLSKEHSNKPIPRVQRPGSRDSADREQSRGGGSRGEGSIAVSKDEKQKRYLASLSEYDRGRYEQLLEKNLKLQNELKGIAQATQDIIEREKNKKKQKRVHEEDQEVIKKTKILREQQSKLNFLKKKITSKKRELDTAYQYPLIREKEDELKNLKRILEGLLDERESVLKIKKEQGKALKDLRYNKEEENRRDELAAELKKIKQENKLLVEKKTELEKIINKNHTKIINGKVYIRELKHRLDDFKKKNDGVDYRNISEKEVEDLKNQIKDFDREKKEMEIRHRQDLRNIERMKIELKKENLKLDKMLQDKDKEMRLNSIKMKELNKLQRHKILKPVHMGDESLEGNQIDKEIEGIDNNEEFEFADAQNALSDNELSQNEQEIDEDEDDREQSARDIKIKDKPLSRDSNGDNFDLELDVNNNINQGEEDDDQLDEENELQLYDDEPKELISPPIKEKVKQSTKEKKRNEDDDPFGLDLDDGKDIKLPNDRMKDDLFGDDENLNNEEGDDDDLYLPEEF